MIGIIGAMAQEVAILKALITVREVVTVMHVEFTIGTLHGKEVVLLESGIGKVNVAVATTLLLTNYPVTHVINTGSAGGIKSDASVGDVVISSEVSYHDVDVTGFGYAWGQVPGLPATFSADEALMAQVASVLEETDVPHFVGNIVTGDAFVNRSEQIAVIKEKFPTAVALEMEAAAVAQVCHVANIPFVVIRALSDIAGMESHVSFDEFLPVAAKKSSEMVEAVVKVL